MKEKLPGLFLLYPRTQNDAGITISGNPKHFGVFVKEIGFMKNTVYFIINNKSENLWFEII